MAAIFGPAANLAAKVVVTGLGLAILGGFALWAFWPNTDYARNLRSAPSQPVPFSHQHHVAGLGLDCRFCHAAVERSADAGLPPTSTCMTCHSQVWTQAELLAPVRRSFADDAPLVWHQVTDLPDYVYFNHGIHIDKSVGCQSCHGAVATMAMTYKAKSLTMGFCLDCH